MANITAAQVKELRDRTSAGMMDCKKALTECDGDLQKAVEWLRKNGMSKADKKASRSTSEGRVGFYVHHDGKQGAMVELLCETDFVARNEKFQELLDKLCKQVLAADPKYTTKDQIPEEVFVKEMSIAREATLNEAKEIIEEAARWQASLEDAEAALAKAEAAAAEADGDEAVKAAKKDLQTAQENKDSAVKSAGRAAGKAKNSQSLIDNPDKLEMVIKGKVEKMLADQCLMSQEYILGDKISIEQMIKEVIGTLGENIKVNRFCRFKIGE